VVAVYRRTSRLVGVLAASLLVAAGCTLLNPLGHYQAGGPEPADGGISPSEAGREGAAPTPEAGCDPTGPFGAPSRVDELDSIADDTLADLSADALTAYLSTNRDGGTLRLMYATRASADASWGSLGPLFPPPASYDDWSVAVSPDKSTAILASDRQGNIDLYVATRSSPLASFGTPAPAAGINSSSNDESPHWAADGKTLYFDSTRDGTRRIYRVSVDGATFGTPAPVTELNTSTIEAVPVVSPDELAIYFLSGRDDPEGDIYVATRSSKQATFGNVRRLDGVNAGGVDAPGWISPDACTLYFSSTRNGPFDIFVARRQR
jgi:Tol biopolymer transport system component